MATEQELKDMDDAIERAREAGADVRDEDDGTTIVTYAEAVEKFIPKKD
jgi:hypothetical protein